MVTPENNYLKMFSMVSKHSPPVSFQNIASFVTGAANLLVPGRVTATTTIPQGATSKPIETDTLLGQPDVQQISVWLNSSGVVDLEEKSQEAWCKQIHWVRALRLSDDCHSYNVQLRIEPLNNSKLVLQVVRPIEAGEELLLWFSEDILAILQIVFLTPANIQGQKKYVCTRCSTLYESPNPLKLHISLQCGRNSITSLWEKLHTVLKSTNFNALQRRDSFNFTLSPEPQFVKQKTAIDLTVAHIKPESSDKSLYRPYQPSAFKPFRKDEAQKVWTPKPTMDSPIPASDEAQIECLVSSLGKSKQGHICLYCGKCYSRKYGLKIHIRTHTGYKPLKCKYCLRPFGDPSNLNKHVRLHAEGNTPYKCDLCGKILVRRRDLERHLKSRHLIEMHPSIDILADSGDDTLSNEERTIT